MPNRRPLPDTARFEKSLKERGLRLTSQRLAVLRAAARMEGHFTAEVLHREMDRSDIGIATVYRAVQLLQELGYIKQAHLPGGSTVYEYSQDDEGHSHAHLQCQRCGAVLELHEDMMADIEQAVLRQYGFQVSDHHITMTGLCVRCAGLAQ